MDEPGFPKQLSQQKIAIWGLGLMGGSLALALKHQCSHLIGIDTNPETAAYAKAHEVVDSVFLAEETLANPQEILKDVDLLILSTPVCVILDMIKTLPSLFPGPLMVMDCGSTKAKIVKALGELPERFEVIGGHPMCGKEKSSIAEADPGIFLHATFALVPLDRSTGRVRQAAEDLVHTVQARVLWIGAKEHDEMVAATSHIPYLLSGALVRGTPARVKPLIGTGFRSTARLAGSSTRMMMDILATNTDPIRDALQKVRGELDMVQELLDNQQYEALAELLTKTREQYLHLINES